jgi:hypothetical protein
MPSRKDYKSPLPSLIKSKISGFCNYEMAANGNMYFNENTMITMSETLAEANSTICRATGVMDSEKNFEDSLYYLDDAMAKPYKDPTQTYEWQKYWKDVIKYDVPGQWDNYKQETMNYLNEIRKPLKAITEDFITREYKFGTYQKIENSLVPSNDPLKSKFQYIGTELEKCNTYDTSLVLTGDEMGATLLKPNGNYDVGEFASDTDKYYIIVNMNPDKTIEIDQEMNGIVFTKGKVVMSDHGKLNGFIIAAGRGYDPSNGNVDGSAADPDKMPQIIQLSSNPDPDNYDATTNLSKLDDGSYASLVFEGTAGQAEINFKLGPTTDPTPEESLNFLISQYSNDDIKNILNRIF